MALPVMCAKCQHPVEEHAMAGCRHVLSTATTEYDEDLLCTCAETGTAIFAELYYALRLENARLLDTLKQAIEDRKELDRLSDSESDAWERVREVTEDRDTARAECEQLRHDIAKLSAEYQNIMLNMQGAMIHLNTRYPQ